MVRALTPLARQSESIDWNGPRDDGGADAVGVGLADAVDEANAQAETDAEARGVEAKDG